VAAALRPGLRGRLMNRRRRRAQLAVRGGSVPAGSAGRKVGADHIDVQAMSEDGGAPKAAALASGTQVYPRSRRPGRSHRMCGAFRPRGLNQGGSRRTRARCISRRPGNDRHAGCEGGRRHSRQATATLAMSVTRCQRLRLIAIHRGAHLPPLHHFRVFQRNRPFKGAGGGWGESLGLRRL
jgi:hypothetical protein